MANKKWHPAFLAVVLLAAAAVVCIVSVNQKALENIDDSGIRREWSSGDVKAAEGLVFRYDEYSSNILRWENTITVEKGGEEFSSAHRFNTEQIYEAEQPTDLSISSNYWVSLSEFEEELAKSLKPGESVSRTLYFRELYENYPIQFTWQVYGDHYRYESAHSNPETLNKLINSMFVLPVGKEDSIEIYVKKDANGTGWSGGNGER